MENLGQIVNPKDIVTKEYVESKADVFWATYGVTTFAEISSAYRAGKEVLCAYDSEGYGEEHVYRLVVAVENAFQFVYSDYTVSLYLDVYPAGEQTIWGAIAEPILAQGILFTTVTPQDIPSGQTDAFQVAVLSTEPTTKYDNWLYIITG